MPGLILPPMVAETLPGPERPRARPAFELPAPPADWRARNGRHDPSELRRYWDTTARSFRSFTGAPSTQLYFRQEQRLFQTWLGPLAGKRLLKLDLWNEVHNTQILRWAARAGARVHAIDIADFTVQTATANFRECGLQPRFAVADVRRIPFREASFDCLYTMGTIEHFDDWQAVLGEIHRVLVPGGTAIVGVPNRRDPFLRPLVVSLLDAFFRYPYGYEQSFSHAELERALEAKGFEVLARDGLLFYPSLLRMADLFCYVRTRRLAPLFAAATWPFDWLVRRFPALNRHGYLIASVVRKRG